MQRNLQKPYLMARDFLFGKVYLRKGTLLIFCCCFKLVLFAQYKICSIDTNRRDMHNLRTFYGSKNESEYFLMIDSNQHFKEITFSNFVNDQSYLSGELLKTDSNRFKFHCESPDSINLTVNEFILQNKSDKAFIEIYKNPWTFSEYSKVYLIINGVNYKIDATSDYQFLIPIDSLKKYRSFYLQYGNSMVKTKTYYIRDTISNYYAISISDYDRNNDFFYDWFNDSFPFCQQEMINKMDNSIDLFIKPLNSFINLMPTNFDPPNLWFIRKTKTNRMFLR